MAPIIFWPIQSYLLCAVFSQMLEWMNQRKRFFPNSTCYLIDFNGKNEKNSQSCNYWFLQMMNKYENPHVIKAKFLSCMPGNYYRSHLRCTLNICLNNGWHILLYFLLTIDIYYYVYDLKKTFISNTYVFVPFKSSIVFWW